MHGGGRPGCGNEGRHRQGPERRFFRLLECIHGRHARGPVAFPAVFFAAPAHGMGIQLVQRCVRIQGAQLFVELPGHRNASFNLSLVFGSPDACRVGERAIMIAQLGESAVDRRVVDIGPQDAAQEVVQVDPPGDTSPEREHGGDRHGEGNLVLAGSELDVGEPGRAQDAAEGVDGRAVRAHRPGSHLPVVDLGFFSRIDLDSRHRLGNMPEQR